MTTTSRIVRTFTVVALFVGACFVFFPKSTDAIVCNPPTVVSGCTDEASDSLNLTAVVLPAAATAPDVTTDSAASIGETTAVLNGTITDTNGADATVVGFNYGTTVSYDMSSLSSGTFGPGSFYASLTGLVCGTTYHYQAYATNTGGTGTGVDMTFTTSACPVIIPPVGTPGGGAIPTTSTVNFRGVAYPGARVVVLRDGNVMVAVTANTRAEFVATVAGVSKGSYVFSVYAQDTLGRLSSPYSFPFLIGDPSIVNIGGILLAPTVSLNSSTITQGTSLVVSGQSAPSTTVRIVVGRAKELVYSTVSDAQGYYSSSIATTAFTDGHYSVHTQTLFGGHASPFSKTHLFSIVAGVLVPTTPIKPTKPTKPTKPSEPTQPKPVEQCRAGRGDFNCDGRVNIVDYSIMKFWYGKQTPPAVVDLYADGMITLKDFSILAAEWTG